MKKVYLALFVMCHCNLVFAENSINCTMNETGNIQTDCVVVLQNASTDEFSHTIKIIRKIDLNPLLKSFKKIISKQLNKRDCEKQVFVKSASLKLKKDLFSIKIMPRITRRYCTRRAKQQVYEKTKSLHFSFSPIVTHSSIKFIDEAPDKKQASFEKSFSDIVGTNIKEKISHIIVSNLTLDVDNLSLPFNKKKPIYYRSVTINPNTGIMTVVMTTAINKDK